MPASSMSDATVLRRTWLVTHAYPQSSSAARRSACVLLGSRSPPLGAENTAQLGGQSSGLVSLSEHLDCPVGKDKGPDDELARLVRLNDQANPLHPHDVPTDGDSATL